MSIFLSKVVKRFNEMVGQTLKHDGQKRRLNEPPERDDGQRRRAEEARRQPQSGGRSLGDVSFNSLVKPSRLTDL